MLDEPGNYLDYAGLEWLEEMLAGFPGGVLLVSHNRRLLDRTVTSIQKLTGGRIREYRGNYTDYRLARLQSLVAQRADYVAAQKRIARLTALVARLAAVAAVRSDKAHGRRLRARRTQLAREERQAVARPDLREERVSVVLPPARSEVNVALQVIGYDRGFGGRVLFRDARLEISCGERVALVGPNGCGKSTLLRDIVTHDAWEHPVLRVGPSLTVGYCAQNQDAFAADQTTLDAFVDLGLGNRREVLGALRWYLFTWDDLDKQIGVLSGGERNRLQIAAAVQRRANFLILGRALVAILTNRFGYHAVHQRGSHIVLETLEPSRHRVVVPDHPTICIGTLNSMLRAVAAHKGIDRGEILGQGRSV